jgi:hypothetical protein
MQRGDDNGGNKKGAIKKGRKTDPAAASIVGQIGPTVHTAGGWGADVSEATDSRA